MPIPPYPDPLVSSWRLVSLNGALWLRRSSSKCVAQMSSDTDRKAKASKSNKHQGSVFLSSELVETPKRQKFWHSVALPFFEIAPLDNKQEEASLRGSLSVSRVREMVVGQVSFNAQKVTYSKHRPVGSVADSILLQVLTSGSLVGEYEGVTVFAGTGDIIVRDLTRLGESQVTEGSALMAIIPLRLLPTNLVNQLHGAVLHANEPETQLLTDFLMNLVNQANVLSPTAVAPIEDAFIGLLSACSLSEGYQNIGKNQYLSATLQEQILRYIDQNITNQKLCIETLQKKFCVSRTHLYRILKPYGGIAKLIRNRRVEAIHRALLDPRLVGHSIEKLAFDFGFSSDKQFRRAFSDRYGVTPGYIRSQYRENRFPTGIDDTFSYFTMLSEQEL